MTKQALYVEALIKMGGSVVPSRIRKYIVVEGLSNSSGLYYVGKAGAVRKGNTVSNSISLSSNWKASLLKAAKQQPYDTKEQS